LPPTDTRFRPDQRLVQENQIEFSWYFVFSLLESGQIDQAEKEKARIEDTQRKRSSIVYNPQWFKQNGDTYTLNCDDDSRTNYWKKREEKWSNVEFIQLW